MDLIFQKMSILNSLVKLKNKIKIKVFKYTLLMALMLILLLLVFQFNSIVKFNNYTVYFPKFYWGISWLDYF